MRSSVISAASRTNVSEWPWTARTSKRSRSVTIENLCLLLFRTTRSKSVVVTLIEWSGSSSSTFCTRAYPSVLIGRLRRTASCRKILLSLFEILLSQSLMARPLTLQSQSLMARQPNLEARLRVWIPRSLQLLNVRHTLIRQLQAHMLLKKWHHGGLD